MVIVMTWPTKVLITECDVNDKSLTSESRFQAVKVVVQPWKGEHNVYGIFVIPTRFKNHRLYSVTLRIQGIDAEFSAGSPESEDIDSLVPGRGYYLRKAYIPTRTALWLFITGKLGTLQVPCHWWLIFVDRAQ
jgi:hypothetical protein